MEFVNLSTSSFANLDLKQKARFSLKKMQVVTAIKLKIKHPATSADA